jgi:hypothetical protein
MRATLVVSAAAAAAAARTAQALSRVLIDVC